MTVRVTLFGAAGEVTGSCYLVETSRARVLVECGLFQGSLSADRANRARFAFDAASLDAVVLTHAHLDHCGRLPLLPRVDFVGPVYLTPATSDLTRVILDDSAAIQEADAERAARKRSGGAPSPPLYTAADVEQIAAKFSPVPYERPFDVAPGIVGRFVDAGHILGSASLELRVNDSGGGPERTVVFSGDVGVRGAPFLHDPTTLEHADLVFLESTYGDRDHRPLNETMREFAGILNTAVTAREKVLIPAFAVGRTQLLIHHVGALFADGRVPRTHIYLDSPMAITATALYRAHVDTLDDDAKRRARAGSSSLAIPELRLVRSAAESQKLNAAPGPMIIIAASGMCDGGRIMHHLRHNLARPNVQVIIAGYQAEGTLGRSLVDGASSVRIFGEQITVGARIHTLGGFSAHAGQSELLDWLRPLAKKRPRVVLTHGEPRARDALRDRIARDFNIRADTPAKGDTIEL